MSARTPRRPRLAEPSRPVRRMTSSVARSVREGAQPVAPRIAIAGVVGAVLFGILLIRLWALTVLGGAEYAARADQNQMRLLPVEAPRGNILDRKGRPIVTNEPARQVILDLQDVPAEQLDEQLDELAVILNVSRSELQRRVDAAPPGAIEPVVLVNDVERNARIFYLLEHADELPGVSIRRRAVRAYRQGSVAAHILGQVGQVSPDELKGSYANLKSGDRVGKSGLERRYDEYLRGVDGYDAMQVDASGIRQGDARNLPATPGRNLKTTIDLSLQKAAEKSLAASIAAVGRTSDGRDAKAGAVVAIEPDTGAVLALASAPTYDPGVFTDPSPAKQREAAWLYNPKNKRMPTLNRATDGAYPPGSIYKAIVGLAALEEGYVTPDTLLRCDPALSIGGTTFKNHDTTDLGSIPLATAIETSCDTYFYRLGLFFFNAKGSPLSTWSEKFGLGSPTGLDITAEGTGEVPSPAWKRKQEGIDPAIRNTWLTGDSVNLSIGQGYLTTTPLQMANVYATIANGGTMRTPHLGQSILDSSGREALVLPQPEGTDLKISSAHMAAVKEGLVLVNSGGGGTATGVFDSFPIPTAGKTGTAEKFGQSDLAWYCGYAPADKPTIAVCAFVDGGGSGASAAAPVVKDVFARWFGIDGAKPGDAVAAATQANAARAAAKEQDRIDQAAAVAAEAAQ